MVHKPIISKCGHDPQQTPGALAKVPQPATVRRARRGRSRFTQADVIRVLKAAQKAQFSLTCVRIELDGTILIIPSTSAHLPSSPTLNDWDRDGAA